MPKSMNKVILMGYVGSDPECRMAGDAKVANFSLATSSSWKDKAGNWQEETQWHKVVAWRNVADTIEKYVKKGSRIMVEGSIKYRTWEDREQNKRYSTEINVFQVYLLGDPKGSTKPVAAGAENAQAAPNFDGFPEALDAEDDDLPF